MIQSPTPTERPANFPSPTQGRSFVRITVRHVVIEADIGCAQDMVELGGLVERAIDKTKRRRLRHPESRYVPLIPAGRKARLLSVEIKDFMRDNRESGLSPSTLERYKGALDMLMVTTGDVNVAEINKEHIRDYWNETFRWWPHHAGSRNDLKGLTNAQILAIGKKEAAKPRSHKFYLLNDSILEAFFERLLQDEAIGSSPMRSVKKRKDKSGPAVERNLKDSDLQEIFHPENYTRWAKKYPHRSWCPMIGLYTGARISEICRLHVSDIIEQHGIWCFSFQGVPGEEDQDEGNRAAPKTEASRRVIPIAQPLLDAGFLTFVQDVKAAKRPRLFPQLKPRRDPKTGEIYGSGYGSQQIVQFGDYLRAKTNMKKGVGSHAFRHTLSTRLSGRPANVDLELIATITGHVPDMRVPTLQLRYIHCDPAELREYQVEALAKFTPPVTLPVYTQGQFLSRLRPGAKVYD